MKNTPGPWQVREQAERYGQPNPRPIILNAECNSAVAEVYAANGDIQANARLIAAAPDLLEALELSLQSFIGPSEFDEDMSPLIEIMKNAIAKAKGES